jgi:hypothetical protein
MAWRQEDSIEHSFEDCEVLLRLRRICEGAFMLIPHQ